jgi:hypothetical protein
VERALELAAAHQERYCEPELHRLLGEVLQAQGHTLEAEMAWWRAIELAQQRGQHAWGLRATLSLVRSQRSRGVHSDAALGHLREVAGTFSAGAISPDLEEARALLG